MSPRSWRRAALAVALALQALVPAAVSRAAEPAASERWLVQGVEADDTLVIRAKPGPRSAIVGTIPATATMVQGTGRRRRVGRSTWREVTFGRWRGWVNGRYLRAAAAPSPVGAAAEGSPLAIDPALDEGFVCYFDQPVWSVHVHKNGTAACRETCRGPETLRVAAARPVGGHPDRWALDIRAADGARYLALSISKTGSCAEALSKERYPYEASVRRPGQSPYRGCCVTMLHRTTPALPPAPAKGAGSASNPSASTGCSTKPGLPAGRAPWFSLG